MTSCMEVMWPQPMYISEWVSKAINTHTLYPGVNLEGETHRVSQLAIRPLAGIFFQKINFVYLKTEMTKSLPPTPPPPPLENSELLNSLSHWTVKKKLYILKVSWGRCMESCLSSYCWPPSLASCSCPVRLSPTMCSKSKFG